MKSKHLNETFQVRVVIESEHSIDYLLGVEEEDISAHEAPVFNTANICQQ